MILRLDTRSEETRNRWRAPVAGLLAFLAFPGCNASVIVTFGSADSGTEIEVNTGLTIEVRLDANPSTGYEWQVLDDARAVLEPLGEMAYEQDRSATGRPGAGGTNVWRFRAIHSGLDTLRMEYRKSWEEGVPPAQTFVCPVRVR